MARLNGYKESDPIVWAAGVQKSIPLERNFHVMYLHLKLSVTHTNATAAFYDGLERLITNIDIVANGKNTIKSIPGHKLRLHKLRTSDARGLKSIQTADGAGKESYEYFMLPLVMPDMARPWDTILNTAIFSSLTCRVNWGAADALGTGITVTAAQLDIETEALSGYKRNSDEPIMYFKEVTTQEEVTSTTDRFQFKLPIETVYKGIQLIALDDKVRSNDIINNIKIYSGATTFYDRSAQFTRAKNIAEFKPNVQADLDGVYMVDFGVRGRYSDFISTLEGSGFNTFVVELDVTKQTGTNEIVLISDYLEKTNLLEK